MLVIFFQACAQGAGEATFGLVFPCWLDTAGSSAFVGVPPETAGDTPAVFCLAPVSAPALPASCAFSSALPASAAGSLASSTAPFSCSSTGHQAVLLPVTTAAAVMKRGICASARAHGLMAKTGALDHLGLKLPRLNLICWLLLVALFCGSLIRLLINPLDVHVFVLSVFTTMLLSIHGITCRAQLALISSLCYAGFCSISVAEQLISTAKIQPSVCWSIDRIES